MLLAISSLVCYVVESTNIGAGLLQYIQEGGRSEVTLFTISGLDCDDGGYLAAIRLSGCLAEGAGNIPEMKSWRLLPFLAAVSLFIFASWEGYLATDKIHVWGMYAVMAALGLIYSRKHPIEWNASLVGSERGCRGLHGNP